MPRRKWVSLEMSIVQNFEKEPECQKCVLNQRHDKKEHVKEVKKTYMRTYMKKYMSEYRMKKHLFVD